MISYEQVEFQWGIEKRLNIYDEHKIEVIENRFARALHEGIQVFLTKEEFMSLKPEERQDWAMIPMEPPWFWARGPICGPVTDLDGVETQEGY